MTTEPIPYQRCQAQIQKRGPGWQVRCVLDDRLRLTLNLPLPTPEDIEQALLDQFGVCVAHIETLHDNSSTS
jgi:hypothetical protein